MIQRQIKVKIPEGLEARPAALFVQVASKFNCRVYVHMQDKKVNAKSIMGMMSLGVIEGETILVTADGDDEDQAIVELVKLMGE